VGYWVGSDGYRRTLAEHWNGSVWSIVSTPVHSSLVEDYLFGVTAITSSDVWAVGYYSNIQGHLAVAKKPINRLYYLQISEGGTAFT
jgi:hypothetical protein